MVKHTIRVLMLLMVGLATNVYAFEVRISKSTVELGKPVWVELGSTLNGPSLERLDLSPLETMFEVVKDRNELKHQKGQQVWRIRLYPRQTGQLTIPALSFNAHHSPASKVTVTDPVDSKTERAFSIDYELSTDTPYVRQEVRAIYKIHSREMRLVLRPQESTDSSLLVLPLTTKQQPEQQHYLHQTGWSLFATQAGSQTVKLPPLYYVRDGVITHRFYPPPIRLNVKPLPTYLPGNIPVGKLHFKISHQPRLVISNRLSTLTLQFQGQGIPARWLTDLRHLFNNNHQFNSYPIENTTRQTLKGHVISQHTWRMPFKTIQQGRIMLPEAHLHYFDPDTGRLAKLDIRIPSFISLSIWSLSLLVMIVIIITLWLAIKLYQRLIPHWRCFKTYRQTYKKLDQLHQPEDIRQVIRQLSEAEGGSGNITPQQWQARQASHIASQAAAIQQQLEASLYQGKQIDMAQLTKALRETCLNRWPRLSHLITI